MADADEAEAVARAARLQAMQEQVTDAGNNVRALKVSGWGVGEVWATTTGDVKEKKKCCIL